ncbi:hypothetical protein [Flavobacterium sp.]|nr:hypothetical protein [Flavobacterium sp.]
MAVKKIHQIAAKKSDAKKEKIVSKTKLTVLKKNKHPKRNEFGDEDAIE